MIHRARFFGPVILLVHPIEHTKKNGCAKLKRASYDIILISHGDLPGWILRTVLYAPVEAHSPPSQTSKMKISARIVDCFKLTLQNIFAKVRIVDVWKGPALCIVFLKGIGKNITAIAESMKIKVESPRCLSGLFNWVFTKVKFTPKIVADYSVIQQELKFGIKVLQILQAHFWDFHLQIPSWNFPVNLYV